MMKMGRLLTTAIHSLRANTLRTFLTLLGIIIGVCAVIILMSIGNATTSTVTKQIQGLGSNLLVITPGQADSEGVNQGIGSSDTLTLDDVSELKKLSSLSNVAPQVSTRTQVIYEKNNYQTSVEGSTPDLFSIRDDSLAAGRFFNLVEEQNAGLVAVIGDTTAENIFGNTNPVGKTVKINNVPYTIIGKLATQGSNSATNNDDKIVIPYTTFTQKVSSTTNPSTIYASAKDQSQMNSAQTEVKITLRNQHGLAFSQEDDFEITNQATLLETLSSVTNTLQTFLGGIAGISLLVGGIGIMNIMMVSVTERTKEIGLRKALGATKQDILKQFIVESALVGVLGGLIGIIIGILGSWVASNLMDSEWSLDLNAVWLSFTVSFIIGIVFGIYPAYRAAKLSPIKALKYD